MEKDIINDFKKYIHPSPSLAVTGIITIAVSPILFFMIYDRMYAIVTSITTLLMGIICVVYFFEMRSQIAKQLRSIEERNFLSVLLDDFNHGGKAFNGMLILGKVFVLGKHRGAILTYSDIKNIYQKIDYYNGIESQRTLIAVTKDNKEHTLCVLKLRGRSDDEAIQVVNYIVSMNPEITVGYKK